MKNKDYEKIAQAMRDVYLSNEWKDGGLVSWARAVMTLEIVLKEDNPRFNSEIFREFCGL